MPNGNFNHDVRIGGSGRLIVNEVVIVDAEGNIDGDVTTTSLDIGSSGSPISYTAGDPVSNFYSTSSSTSGSTSAQPFLCDSVMTGAGGVGGRAMFSLATNVALGGWSNALKGQMTYGSSGKTTGLGSAILAEMSLSAGTVDGTYCCSELELNMGSGASTGTQSTFQLMSVNGADAATFDTNGGVFAVNGLTKGSGKAFQDNNNSASQGLKIFVDGTPYWILLTNASD